ncbi:MAG TPA: N-acetyltransferase [Firmicutes bacterium]|jgi:amino-acid N-acetyltransferase|nr:N-acetyltransferase [Bacillota bacterium]
MIFRKAKISDVEQMASLINYYAEQGLMLHRTLPSLYQKIRDYTLIVKNNKIIGVGGLHVLWRDLSEICSLAIDPGYKNNGLGQALVGKLLQESRELGIEKVFTLTYQPAFFEKSGFTRIGKEHLPQKVWTECVNCPKFPNCDEIALIKSNDEKAIY